jgi:hypothetical protein
MKRLELICDHCGKVGKGDDNHFSLPKGWYLLGFHCQTFLAPDEWRVTNHFCCTECLNLFMMHIFISKSEIKK